MKSAPLALSLVLLVVPTTTAQSTPQERVEISRLQRQLDDLRSRHADAARRTRELVRLRITHDLQLPVPVVPAMPPMETPRDAKPEDLRRELRESAQRAERLTMQLRELQAKGFLEPVQPVQVPAQPPRVEIESPRLKGPVPRSTSPDAIVSLAKVPRARRDQSDELRIDVPLLLRNPLHVDEPKFQLEPAANRTKAIDALLRAGRERDALLLLDQVLEENKDSLPHLFLKGQALERLGRAAEAIEVFQGIVTIDTVVDSNDRPLPGPWAKSARLASEHLTWMQRFGGWQGPNLAELDW